MGLPRAMGPLSWRHWRAGFREMLLANASAIPAFRAVTHRDSRKAAVSGRGNIAGMKETVPKHLSRLRWMNNIPPLGRLFASGEGLVTYGDGETSPTWPRGNPEIWSGSTRIDKRSLLPCLCSAAFLR